MIDGNTLCQEYLQNTWGGSDHEDLSQGAKLRREIELSESINGSDSERG
ncbi:MAG: hypothetical protein KDC53_22025 [Saprospiraceae bacterium]|nr:hypothetical protein [Saprospiraceae bacterium]